MYKFKNTTTKEQYEAIKRSSFVGLSFEYVPNTATGFEDTRKYIHAYGHKYLLSANTEKDYFLHIENNENFSVWFRVEDDFIEIKKASCAGRTETAERYLKKYANVVTMMHSIIKYDKIVRYTRYI